MQEALKPDRLGQYAVLGDLEAATHGKLPASGLVSLPRHDNASKNAAGEVMQLYKKASNKGKRKSRHYQAQNQHSGKKSRVLGSNSN